MRLAFLTKQNMKLKHVRQLHLAVGDDQFRLALVTLRPYQSHPYAGP